MPSSFDEVYLRAALASTVQIFDLSDQGPFHSIVPQGFLS